MTQIAESYLEGLLVGRGRLFRSQRRILIEFPHKNPTLTGIAHCPSCGWLATGFSHLKCKNSICGKSVDSSVKEVYEQHIDTKTSLTNVIVPFLNQSLDCDIRISPGNYSTHLFLDFPANSGTWQSIEADFPDGQTHHDLRLPSNLRQRDSESKREFINGLLDTAGFVNSGGWLPRDGANGHGRMRLYFQIVRNWQLVVDIDNFLRHEFAVPIQTIDWGHPNIRSSSGSENAGSSTTREHQIKIFPEYMSAFMFRISCKQKLFAELLRHNQSVGFSQKEDWFPPRTIPDSQRKPMHPSEQDPRLPGSVRRHFDAFWQINLALGCEYLEELSVNSVNREVFALTGNIKSDENLDALRIRLSKLYELENSSNHSPQESSQPKSRQTPEFDTYEPLRKWLELHLQDHFDSESIAWTTAEQNLVNFLSTIDDGSLQRVENLEDLRIRPDVVGVIPSTGELAFIESKVTNINLREVGQLLGYCLVAQPKLAFLISTKPIDVHLKELINNHPALVEYGFGRSIQLLHFDTEKMDQPEGIYGAS
jgi:hypothetical protein